MFSIDLKGFSTKEITFFTLITFLAFLPAYLFLYSFDQQAFNSNELFKLILLCLAITTPIIVLNFYFTFSIFESIRKARKESFDSRLPALAFSVIPTGVIIYFPILINHFFNISKYAAVNWVLGLQFLLVIIYLVVMRRKSKQFKNSSIGIATNKNLS
jgi:ABC-type xylose transport system permease subunit